MREYLQEVMAGKIDEYLKATGGREIMVKPRTVKMTGVITAKWEDGGGRPLLVVKLGRGTFRTKELSDAELHKEYRVGDMVELEVEVNRAERGDSRLAASEPRDPDAHLGGVEE